jgi:hypothetical protein
MLNGLKRANKIRGLSEFENIPFSLIVNPDYSATTFDGGLYVHVNHLIYCTVVQYCK